MKIPLLKMLENKNQKEKMLLLKIQLQNQLPTPLKKKKLHKNHGTKWALSKEPNIKCKMEKHQCAAAVSAIATTSTQNIWPAADFCQSNAVWYLLEYLYYLSLQFSWSKYSTNFWMIKLIGGTSWSEYYCPFHYLLP